MRLRGVLGVRAVVVGGDVGVVREGLVAVAEGGGGSGVVVGSGVCDGRVVFVFPGQGAQWVGMAVELLGSSSVFAGRMAECERALGLFVDWSLVGVLGDEVALGRVEVVQPVLWAVMVSLAAVWESWGVRPSVVVGHSQGEIAAACVAGVLSLEDGARVVVSRSALIGGLSAGGVVGGMTSVGVGVEVVRGLLEGVSGVEVAAVNGPSATVVSGVVSGLEVVERWCEERGVRWRRVPVSYASHSSQVEGVRDELLRVLGGVRPGVSRVPFFSTVVGRVVDGGDLDAGYWFENLRRPVLLESVVAGLAGEGVGAFVEVSPHPVLVGAVVETVESVGSGAVVVGSLRRGEGGLSRLLLSAGELFVRGVGLDLSAWVPVGNRVELPSYAFQRRRFWLGSVGGDVRSVGLVAARHSLVAGSMRLADGDGVVLTGRLSVQSHGWLVDHVVGDVVLVPGAALVELAVRAGDEVGCDRVEELTLHTPLELPRRGGVHLQVVLGGPDGSGRRGLGIYSRLDGAGVGVPFTRHASGVLVGGGGSVVGGVVPWPPVGAEVVSVEGFYEGLAGAGYRYGPVFRGLRAAWCRGGEVFAEVVLPEGVEVQGFALHPALLDGALQAIALVPGVVAEDRPRLPFAFTGVEVGAVGARVLRVRLVRGDDGSVSVSATDPAGVPVVTIESLITRP
ncbi:acyltransferase domain-containing protein, partial [Micromonospora wenchangensis]|uniref:acyltransferase domain-containing protein n=1 Tax=Micromonospora wenchangensis TaxID=1185415 RepID=UPI003D70558A